jgi:hypothetical protein
LIMASATPQAAGSTPVPRSRQWALRARCHNEAEGRSVDQWPAPCRRVSARCWDCDAANAPAAGEMMVGSVLPGVNRFFWKPSDRGGMRDTSARRRVARGHDGGHALLILQQSLWDAGHPLAFCRRRYTGLHLLTSLWFFRSFRATWLDDCPPSIFEGYTELIFSV